MGGRNSSNQSQTSQSMNSQQGINSSFGANYGVNQSGQSSQGSSQQQVWGTQTPYLEDVYTNAQDQYGQAIGQINGMQPQVQGQVNDAFNQGMAGYGNQLGGGFAAGLQGQVGENAYVNSLAGDLMSDAAKIKQQSLGSLDARAAAAGMSGSSGYREQVNDMTNDIDEQTMQGLNQLRFNSFNQGVQNNMNLAGMMDRNQQGAMSNMTNIQQGAMNQFNPALAGLTATGAYGQVIGGPTTLSSSQQSSNGFSNGMNAGLNMSGGINNGFASSSSSGSGNSSGWQVNPVNLTVGVGG